MLELNSRPTLSNGRFRTSESQQPRRLLLALVLLVLALVGLLVKDRQFWFGSEQATIESDVETAAPAHAAVKSANRPVRSVTTPATKKQAHPAAVKASAEQPSDAPVVTRTVLPPLDVEVVAGDKHRKVHPGANATHVEIPNPATVTEDASAAAPSTNAAEREALAGAAQDSATPYPLLAQHMHVQGSVVLQALIGTDGIVQNLRVMSGPAILASAAQQAVREWRFKPIVQNGQAVESKATITVNFSIKVADNSVKTTLAESRASESLIITR